jgi:hypothetical protein
MPEDDLVLHTRSSHPFSKEEIMNARMTTLTVALTLFAATAYAGDPNLGTWKVNESKSMIPPGSPKMLTVVLEQAADGVKVTVDGVDREGKPYHNEWTGKYDGKDYPVVGSAQADTRSMKRIDAHHFDVVNKKNGKPTIKVKVVVAKEGKSKTESFSGMTADGKPVTATFFLEKQ